MQNTSVVNEIFNIKHESNVCVNPEEIDEGPSEIMQNSVKECGRENNEDFTKDTVALKKSLEPNSSNILSKRTRHRNNKSIIESAIARKERFFEPYEKPKNKRGHRFKVGDLFSDVSPLKTVSDYESKNDSLSKEPFKSNFTSCVRKSPRKIASESKKSMIIEHEDEAIKTKLGCRLCKCTEDKKLYMQSPSLGPHFCSAIDSLDNKLVGCSREVNINIHTMLRPSARVSFGLFCESHKKRLIKHNCCSVCGTFCTQGDFLECPFKHHYHNSCKLSLDGKHYCPHCGSDSTARVNVHIKMRSVTKPVVIPMQKSQPSARMSCVQLKSDSNKRNAFDVFPTLIENIRKLNKANCDSAKSNFKTVDLTDSIVNGDEEKVLMILERNNNRIDLKTKLKDHNNGSFLHLAVSKGNLLIVHMLVINPSINVDFLDGEQHTALMVAILQQNNEIVEYLVKSGRADLTLRGVDGITALHLAAKIGNLSACKYIVVTEITLLNIQDDGGWSPLVWACEHGHLDVVKYLLSRGADIDIRDVEQNATLHWAAFKGSTQIVQLLLAHKADVNAVNVHGDTPLHISARVSHYGCVIYLLTQKADVTIINKNNETPFDCAPDGSACSVLLANRLKNYSSNSSLPKRGLLVNDISRGREINPIQCYNDFDDAREPRDYSYVSKNCITSALHVNMNIKAIQPCLCTDKCNGLNCACAKHSLRCWYDDEGKLLPEFNFCDSPLIFECNDLCECNKILCKNRAVQKGPSQRFQLFRTERKGWGIKTLNFIPLGSYVCEYIGELMPDSEAELREDDSYLFDLDNKETDSYAIDAKFYGNFARFINHCCEPNLHPVKVFVDHHDLRFPRIALFAKKDIRPEEELSFDYGEKFWLVKYKSFTCDCRADTCKYSKDTIGKIFEKYSLPLL